MGQKPSNECQHCCDGHLYRRGMHPMAELRGGIILYYYDTFDDGLCPKCKGTNRADGETEPKR